MSAYADFLAEAGKQAEQQKLGPMFAALAGEAGA